MSRKDGSYLGHILLNIKHAKPRHPLISMVNNTIFSSQETVIEALHHFRRGKRKHRSLVIIAISMQTIYLIIIPKLSVNFVLMFKKRFEINENGDRSPRNSPTTNTNLKPGL